MTRSSMPLSSGTSDLISELEALAASATSAQSLMTAIAETLSQRMPSYNWVGFYMIERQSSPEPVLELGPYVGAPTPHTRIPLNQGICGAAVSTGETLIVDDVNSDPRYLACSLETKSEIVIPIRAHGAIIGELDIDSHIHAAFREDDRTVCEHAADLVGCFVEKHGAD